MSDGWMLGPDGTEVDVPAAIAARERMRRRRWPRVVLAAVLLLMLYALSIGPAFRFGGRAATQKPFYWPMTEIARFRQLGDLEAWYLNVWSTGQEVRRMPGDRFEGEVGIYNQDGTQSGVFYIRRQ